MHSNSLVSFFTNTYRYDHLCVRHQVIPQVFEQFSESSTVVMQLPCCLGKQGELSENCLQNLENDLMADSLLYHNKTILQLYSSRWSQGSEDDDLG